MTKSASPLLEQVQEVWGYPEQVAKVAWFEYARVAGDSPQARIALKIGVIAGGSYSPDEFIRRFTSEIISASL